MKGCSWEEVGGSLLRGWAEVPGVAGHPDPDSGPGRAPSPCAAGEAVGGVCSDFGSRGRLGVLFSLDANHTLHLASGWRKRVDRTRRGTETVRRAGAA